NTPLNHSLVEQPPLSTDSNQVVLPPNVGRQPKAHVTDRRGINDLQPQSLTCLDIKRRRPSCKRAWRSRSSCPRTNIDTVGQDRKPFTHPTSQSGRLNVRNDSFTVWLL